jgi:RNA polymerase sigma-70 factor (ECF subfamily)
MSAVLTVVPTADDVLQRAKDGNQDAFAAIIARHQSMVFGIAWHFFGDRDRGEEIAQDVFLKLYRNLGSIQSASHLLFWLRQVASRRCIDEVRRGGPRRVSLEDVDPPVAPATGDPLMARRLREMVRELPEMHRLVITLRYQEDLDPSEISEIVGKPVNTIKSYLHRAIVALRKKMGVES